MEEPEEPLSPSRALLLSLHFASNQDFKSLRNLVASYPTVFPAEVLLEVILRFVPESVGVEGYGGIVGDVVGGRVLIPATSDGEGKGVDEGYVKDINELSARKTLEVLNFPDGSLKASKEEEGEGGEGGEGILEKFVKERAFAIDREIGQIGVIKELVEYFVEGDEGVYGWYLGVVGVVEGLVFDTLPAGEEKGVLGLEEFEKLEVRDGVFVILDRMVTESGENVGKGVEMVTAYIDYKNKKQGKNKKGGRKGDGWKYMFEWISKHAVQRFGIVWKVVRDWNDGPDDDETRKEYFKTIMAGCYSCIRTDEEAVQQMQDVVYRIAAKLGVELIKVRGEEVEKLVEGYLNTRGGIGVHGEWDAGELVTPTAPALRLLEQLIVSIRMFAMFPLMLTVKEVMRMRFVGSKEDQLGLLKRGLQVSARQRSESGYGDVRSACEFLRVESRVFGRLSSEDVEVEVLRDMLGAGKFMAVTTTYVTPKGRKVKPLLPPEVVEKAVIHAVVDFYDKSTNGNRTRGGMKNASNALAILFPSHSNSLPLRRLSKLLSATHSLSEYSLTLTPGTPLKPVQIRLYPDPPELISRVLQSNPKAYLQLDSLVKIAQDLVYGVSNPHYHHGEEEREPTAAETAAVKSRITGMCVEAALAEDDFETAFSFVVNKLVPTHQKLRSSSSSSSPPSFGPGTTDTAWQAALQAGRYRSPAMLAESMEGVATSKGIEQVQKRMEVLSQALVICPGEAVMDVLRTWKGCEDELESLLELEVQEERIHAGKLGQWVGSTLAIPARVAGGGAGGGLLKAPMSLLGAASSAGGSLAKTLGGTAFPLRSGAVSRQSEEGSQRGSGEFDRGGWTVGEDGERVRKRDVISGMVTSGLASGIGWMLGAKAEDMNQQR
ncbi:hypothetical protein TWF281_004689 [Arthrobotrys megalospora]